jgi:hypothetical protein
MECPECGAECGYEHAEPDVGVRGGYGCPECGWASEECDPNTDDPDDDDR